MTKIKLASIFTATLFISGFSTPLLAQTNVRELQQEKREERQEKKDELLAKRCERAKVRIENHVERRKKLHDRRVEAVANIAKGLNSAIKKAKEAGLDTSAVEKDIQSLVEIRQRLAASHDLGKEIYQTIESIQCGEKQGDLKDLLKKSQEQDKTYLKETREDLKNSLDKLKTDTKSLKEEARKLRTNKSK
jgi:gas vesicle protein